MEKMRWAGHEVRVGERRSTHRVLVREPEGRCPLGRPMSRWENNNKIVLLEYV